MMVSKIEQLTKHMARNRKSKDADDESFDSAESPRLSCLLLTLTPISKTLKDLKEYFLN